MRADSEMKYNNFNEYHVKYYNVLKFRTFIINLFIEMGRF